MAKNCIMCGNKVGFFSDLSLDLEDGTILCAECASAIQSDITKLYGARTRFDFDEIKGRIVDKSKEIYSAEIQTKIFSLIEKIGRESEYLANEGSSTTYSSESTPLSVLVEKKVLTDAEENFGGKLKLVARIILWSELISAIITGFSFMVADEDFVLLGLGIAAGGSLIAYLSYVILSAFGQLVENSDKLVKHLENKE